MAIRKTGLQKISITLDNDSDILLMQQAKLKHEKNVSIEYTGRIAEISYNKENILSVIEMIREYQRLLIIELFDLFIKENKTVSHNKTEILHLLYLQQQDQKKAVQNFKNKLQAIHNNNQQQLFT